MSRFLGKYLLMAIGAAALLLANSDPAVGQVTGTSVASVSTGGGSAKACVDCITTYDVECGYIDICFGVEEGFSSCQQWGPRCEPECSTSGIYCVWHPRSLAADGSIRPREYADLSIEAIAAIVGASEIASNVQRSCDLAVVAKVLDEATAKEQRESTRLITL